MSGAQMFYQREVFVSETGVVSYGEVSLTELIPMTIVPGVPGKPTPPGGGTEPPLVIWGPGDPRPTLPIAGWNPDGSWGPKPPVVEPPPGEEGTKGIALPWPANVPEPPKPEGLPEGSVPVVILYPGERYAAPGWSLPYPSGGPVAK